MEILIEFGNKKIDWLSIGATTKVLATLALVANTLYFGPSNLG